MNQAIETEVNRVLATLRAEQDELMRNLPGRPARRKRQKKKSQGTAVEGLSSEVWNYETPGVGVGYAVVMTAKQPDSRAFSKVVFSRYSNASRPDDELPEKPSDWEEQNPLPYAPAELDF